MAEATTRGVPSHSLRAYIVEMTNVGTRLQQEVVSFAMAAKASASRFAEQVDPLRLSDESYELVAGACGLTGLLDIVERMGRALSSVVVAS